MEVLRKHLKKQWLKYAVVFLILGNVFLGLSLVQNQIDLKEANNVIDAKVNRIQEFDKSLGISDSKLLRQKDLLERHKAELGKMGEKFKNIIEAHDLKLKERNASISHWKGKALGGSQSTTISKKMPKGEGGTAFETVVDIGEVCKDVTIGYKWADEKSRFHLNDPDISKAGDEEFTYSQYISLKGYVFSDSTGKLQIQRVEINEVYPVTIDGKVEFKKFSNQEISLVRSEFEYINKFEDTRSWTDVFGVRILGIYGSQLFPGLGVELANLGRWVDWVNFGVYGKVAFNPFDGISGLQESTIGVGISYNFIPPFFDTNFALGLSLNTPFNDLGRFILSLDVIFYLNNW